MRRVFGGRKHPGLRDGASLRGEVKKRGSWSVQEIEGDSNPSKDSEPTTTGCSRSYRGGEPQSSSSCGVACAGKGGVLHSERLGSRVTSSPFQPALAASGNWVGSLPASDASKSGGLWGSMFAACLQRRGLSFDVFRVTHCLLPSKEGGCRGPHVFERGGARRGANARRTLRLGGGFVRSEDWSLVGCARASDDVVAEVNRRRRTQRSVWRTFHPKGRQTGTGV